VIRKAWHVDVFDNDDVQFDSVMCHTKFEAELVVKDFKHMWKNKKYARRPDG